MKSRFVLVSLILLSLFGSSGFADEAPPARKPPIRPPQPAELVTVPFVIQTDETIQVPELRVPKSQAGSFQSVGTTGTGSGSGISSTQTIVGGLFLSCAIIAGGLWLVRSRMPKAVKAGAALAFLIAGTGSAVAVFANKAAPPPYWRAGTLPRALQNDKELSGNVKIVLVDSKDDTIRLVLPVVKTNRSE
jgi:hypothetical protein